MTGKTFYISCDLPELTLRGQYHCPTDKAMFVTITYPYKNVTAFQYFMGDNVCGENDATEGRALWLLKQLYDNLRQVEAHYGIYQRIYAEYSKKESAMYGGFDSIIFSSAEEKEEYRKGVEWKLDRFYESLIRENFSNDEDWHLEPYGIQPYLLEQILASTNANE